MKAKLRINQQKMQILEWMTFNAVSLINTNCRFSIFDLATFDVLGHIVNRTSKTDNRQFKP